MGWAKWAARGAGAIVGVAAFGFAAEMVIGWAEADRFPPPGRMIDVGGYRLHIDCRGDGDRAVVLDAGPGGFSAKWGWVQPLVATRFRTCAYDRAGHGWSEIRPDAPDAFNVNRDLNRLMDRSGEPQPIILVGQGIAGGTAMLYAARWRRLVAGIVVIDPVHPETISAMADRRAELDDLHARTEIAGWLSPFGILRPLAFMRERAIGLPNPAHDAAVSIFVSARHIAATNASLDVLDQTLGQIRTMTDVGDLPLLAISTRSADDPALVPFLRLSRRAQQLYVPASNPALALNEEAAAMRIADVIIAFVARGALPPAASGR